MENTSAKEMVDKVLRLCEKDNNLTFYVKDVIRAMEVALKLYGDIPVKINFLGFFLPKTPINFLIYNNKEKCLRFDNFRNEETAFSSMGNDEEIVFGITKREEIADEVITHCIQLKEKTDEAE